jgi:putative hydrolase of the HAD superfamily
MNMIKAIVFDWGGVFIDSPYQSIVDHCAKILHVDNDRLNKSMDAFLIDFQKGKISENEWWNKVCGELKCALPEKTSLWRDAVEHTFVKKEEMYALVRELRTKGYMTGLLSNTERPTRQYFFDNDLMRYFDKAIFSCDEGIVKPDPRIYALCQEQMMCRVQEMIFVDDKAQNVQAARSLGMHGIHFVTTKQCIQSISALGIDVT